MTSIYFVRHAQPIHSWEDDRSRPLSPEGIEDSKQVTGMLKAVAIDRFISSPYRRSINTIAGSAVWYNKQIQTDERFRERKSGRGSNNFDMIRKRWDNFNFCEEEGETLGSVQARNIEALQELLCSYPDRKLVIGTHGTALSTILNYYDRSFLCEDFFRIIDYMPYIIRLDFAGSELVAKEEILIVEKQYNAGLLTEREIK